jgi:hypothetical protein
MAPMKIKNLIRSLLKLPSTILAFARRRRAAAVPPPEQMDLELDQITANGLRLREALPVRSAEYWLELGEPDLALKELETLPETARRHAWPLRVRLNALHAANR